MCILNRKAGFVLLAIATSACTHTLYQAELDAVNSAGKPIKSVVYWSKTDEWFGESKAGPVVLLSECSSRRLDFVESDQGIVFWGKRGRDRLSGQSSAIIKPTVCGQITQAETMTDLTTGTLPVIINCTAGTSAVATSTDQYTQAYLAARPQPYLFEVKADSHWSLTGTTIVAPTPPECR
jgi:hypothetical protein